ncbi:MAG: MarR family transcriptional regulator [Evtepia gabavorous]
MAAVRPDDGAPHSQKQICQEWGLPKTTLNTTLKQAEAKGIDPRPHRGEAAERQICLTAAGQAYARVVLRPIYGAEDAALQATLDRYGPAVVAALVEAVDYFGRCLRDSFAKQMEEKENDDNP